MRELVVFAPHSLLGDPPFSRVDLVSCRVEPVLRSIATGDRYLSRVLHGLDDGADPTR